MQHPVIDYAIESEHSICLLEGKVRARFKDGWEPLGGVQIVAPVLNGSEVAPLYVQSLVKRGPAA